MSTQSVGKLGEPYTNLPPIYQTQSFDEDAYKQAELKSKYGPSASKRNVRQFDRYMKSDAGVKALESARTTHNAAEHQKWSSSYSDYAAAIAAQSKARMLAAKQGFDNAVAAFDKPTAEDKTIVESKPQLKPKWSATNANLETGSNTYTVQAGNTLGQIVADYNKKNNTNLNWQDVATWSGISDPSKMSVGHVINFTDPNIRLQSNSEVDLKQEEPVAIEKPEVPQQSLGFNLESYITDNGLNSKYFGGKRYARVDPDGAGDFWVDESGKIFESTLGGGLGSQIFNTGINSNYAFDTKRGKAYRSLAAQIAKLNTIPTNKQGGTMNRINYFQQGGAAPQQQDIKAQVTALVQAAMQGDQKATQQVNQIMEAAKAGDQQAMQIAQIMEQVVKEMQGQAVAAKYGAKLDYLQSLKCGGKAKAKKRQQGGTVCPDCDKQVTKHQYGGSFYSKWSDGDIRKLQMFLSGRKGKDGNIYYEGDYSGAMDKALFDAIKAYQRDNGFTADGMWGYNTNQVHRVLDSDTLRKGTYRPTHKTEQGNLKTYNVSGQKMKESDYYKAVNKLKEQFYADPEAFWKAGGETAKWREHLYTTPEGTAIMEEFYSATPEDVRKKLGSRVTNRKMQQDQMDSGIRNATDRAAHVAVTKVLPAMGGIVAAPITLTNPVTAGLAIGGGLAGRKIAGSTAENLVGNDTTTWTSVDGMGNVASVATPTSEIVVPVAEAAGGAAGAALGAWGSQYVGTPSTQGLAGYRRVNNSAPARTYRSQRRVGGGRFGKRGHYGDGKALDAQVRLNDGTFGYKYQPATPEYQAYLEGAGGNPSYAVVPIGMKNGGLIPRKK